MQTPEEGASDFTCLFSNGEPLIQIQLVPWFVGAVNGCLEKIVAICFIILPRSFLSFDSFIPFYIHTKHTEELENLSTKALVNLSLYDTCVL